MDAFEKDTMYYLTNGELIDAYEHFGAHLVYENNQVVATRFRVYAPNAKTVSVIGEFNQFDPQAHPMTKIDEGGVFSVVIKDNLSRQPYKYALTTLDGQTIYKSDPYAFYSAKRPDSVSIVAERNLYEWQDEAYMKKRVKEAPYQKPMNVYEVHLGTWMQKPDGSFHTYADLVDLLIPYLKKQYYTHVEIMPVIEHPFDGSWGYQGTGYYSVTSRYGTVDDFKYFIDKCHQNDIKVILDWVPGHFVKDEHGLANFDGTHLFEYSDEHRRENPSWGTVNFDLGKGVTQSYLISSACFFLNEYHVDGFRVDAVSYMIYYHGDTSKGENDGALTFLKKLSKAVFKQHPHALLIAEDSSAYPKVTHPIHEGGLGFNYKWNMGWMNDTLSYFSKDPIHRKYHHNLLTFSLMYAFSENYVLPFSHDEVVHGKKSLVDKMPGDYWQKFANYRALIGYMHAHPGKTLLFMGQEFAQMHEWKDYAELDWHLLSYPMHESAQRFNRDMNQLSQQEPALHEADHDPQGFEWIDADNNEQSIFSFVRYDAKRESHVLCVFNLTPVVHHDFILPVPNKGVYDELISSDHKQYGGSDLYNGLPLESFDYQIKHFTQAISVLLPPLSMIMLKWRGSNER